MRVPAIVLIQPARRTLQLIVILFLMFTAFFSMYGVLKHHGLLLRMDVRFFQAVYYPMDAVMSLVYQSYDDVFYASTILKGSTWIYTVGSLKLADPLAALTHVVTSRSISSTLVLAAAFPVAFTLVFGRAFCGWMCPVNTLLEVLDRIRNSLPGRDVRFGYDAKYYILGIGLVLSFAGLPVFHWIYPPIVLAQEVYSYVFYLSFGAGAVFLLGIALFEVFVSRRAWCRYFCPGGALFSILGSRSLVGLRRDEEACSHKICMECREACMLGLDPVSGKDMRECSKCGQCIPRCPEMALRYSLTLPRVGDDKKN